ncbi:MAG: AEC family transporter [Candidatus Cloacimonetes bacterium]|nr:AEC family transporter [Candidatus Cloacimonadota bacterium]
MTAFFLKVIPLILAFFFGVFVRQVKLMQKDDASILLKLVLTATLPALALLAIIKVELKLDLLFLPFTAQMVVFMMYGVAFWVGKRLKLPTTTFGSFLVGCMIMNTGFSLPFFVAAFGTEGLVRASLFDLGNVFLIFTFIYYNAIKYGDNCDTCKIDWMKFVKLPPLWGLLIGLAIRITHWQVPEVGINFLELIGQPTSALIMIALGLIFEPKLKRLGAVMLGIILRMGVGLFFGWLLTVVFGIEGMTRTIIIAGSCTPVGFNTVIFANLENMDREFAASMVSISILIALGFLPLIIWLFS